LSHLSPLLPPPPPSPLFPYTTLFRSCAARIPRPPAPAPGRRSALGRLEPVPGAAHAQKRRRVHPRQGPRAAPEREPRVSHADPGDRKSTRLNSSHVSISYAVFCLKKK